MTTDVNNNSVTETNRIETDKSESSNGNSNSNKSGRWDVKAQSKNVRKKTEKKKIYILGGSMVKYIKG